jgi:hypothetical protein
MATIFGRYAHRASRWLFASPLLTIAIFTALFDGFLRRFDFAGLFAAAEPGGIEMRAAFLLVLLGVALVALTSLQSLAVAGWNLHLLRGDPGVLRFWLGAIALASAGFAAYNILGHHAGLAGFTHFLIGPFEGFMAAELAPAWGLSERALSALYFAPLALTIVAAVSLACSALAMTERSGPVHGAEAAEALRVRRDHILATLYSASLQISAFVAFMLFWQFLQRAALPAPEAVADYDAFVFAYGLYWGAAFSGLLASTFVPVILVYNFQVHRLTRDPAAPKDAPERISFQATTNIPAMFAPLITGLFANAASFFP